CSIVDALATISFRSLSEIPDSEADAKKPAAQGFCSDARRAASAASLFAFTLAATAALASSSLSCFARISLRSLIGKPDDSAAVKNAAAQVFMVGRSEEHT